jgi:L-alanine-DL-glutamate epimerase-like enolase superfamily enzyme
MIDDTALRGTPVQAVHAAAYAIPADAPSADGTLEWDKTTMVVVTADAAGQTGLGWTYSAEAAAALVRTELAGVVVGCDMASIPAANEALYRAVRNFGRGGIAATAISALDIALWDLKARLLDRPLACLLGEPRPVHVYGSGGFTSYDDQLRDQLTGWVAELRIPRVKIKIAESWGHNEQRDLARIELAREIIGPATELYADANGGYTRMQAARVAAEMAPSRVSWFEEPVTSDDVAGLAALREELEPDVTAGEYSWTLTDSARLLDARAVDCLQIDVARCGGVTGFVRAAGLAAEHGLQVSGHCAPNLHARVAAAIPNVRHVEYFHDHQRIERMLFDGALSPAGGVMTPDYGRPGLGLELRPADAAQFLVCG